MDPRSTPETILRGDTANQIATGGIDAWPPRTSRAAAPDSAYAVAMPPNDSGRLDEHQRFTPPGPERAQKQPKQPVSWAKALIRSNEDTELVAQRKNLEQKISSRGLS